MMELVFDMGGSKTRVALVSEGVLGPVTRIDTDRSATGFAKFLGVLQELVGDGKVRAIAGSMPGHLEGKDGRLTLALNLPEWANLPVRSRLEELFECPVYIMNDVEMGGLGEAHEGAGISKGVMAYFTVSTGVNAARVVDGRVDTSIHPNQIGQQLVGEIEGAPAMLEMLTGGAALEAKFGKPPSQIRDLAVWKAEHRYLARGVYNTLLHWTPEVVVFGGSMMRDIDLVRLADELGKLPTMGRRPRLERAGLGDMAGLHGAVVWLQQTR
jgi:glucokinase